MAVIPAEGAQCRQCGQWREQADFYLRNPESGNRYNRCRFCATIESRERQSTLQDRVILPKQHDRDRTEKKCTGCQEVLPITAFQLLTERTGRRRERCQPCHNASTRQYKLDHAEEMKAAAARYRDKDRAAYNERCRKWHQEHREVSAERSGRWKHNNPDAVNASTHKRRTRLAENGGNYTAAEWQALKAKYDHRCLMCRRQEPEIKLTVDHVVPVDQGGSNSIENIQPLCKSCNSKKHRNVVDLRQRVTS